MSLQSTAQDQLLVVDPSAIMPLEVSLPIGEGDMEGFGDHMLPAHEEPHMHQEPEHGHKQDQHMQGDPDSIEVSDPGDLEIVVDELPGAPHGTKDPEPVLEVADEPLTVEEAPADDAKKVKNEKWDWSSKGPHGFVAWIKEKIQTVPKHSGYDTAGLERAMAYMEKLDSEISKAMRMDLDGELDANKVEEVRAKLDEGISRLQARLDKVKESKKSPRKRKKSAADLNEIIKSFSQQDVDGWIEKTGVPGEAWDTNKALQQLAEYFSDRGIVKEAQKILGVSGVYIMAPLLISGIARICINGTVSAGHDIRDLYSRQVKQWKLSDREQFELKQLLFDMGFPMPYDRSVIADQDFDPGSEDNYELMPNYKG